MAEQQQGGELDQDQFCCPVCLDLLKEPVTLQCGHSYCISCINDYWDQYEKTGVYSCPQCRESFSPRPVLRKNTLLAEVVMKLSSTGAQQSPAASAAPLYAGPADVACDFCTGARRRKALMSCLVCLASCCETHLQPHYNVPVLQKHKLVPATNKLQEKMCSSHNKLMEVFCRTDRQCICYLCTMDEHKGHDTVSAAAEKAEKQKQLVTSQEEVQQKIQEKKKELKDLRQVLEDLNSSAEAAVDASDRIFSEMMVSIERRRGELKQLIGDQQQTAVSQTEALLRQLEQTLEQLERRHAELEELSNTEDIITFIQSFQSLSSSTGSPVSPSVIVRPPSSFTDVTDVVSALRDQLDNILKTTWPQIAERAPDPKDPEAPSIFGKSLNSTATAPRKTLNSTAAAPRKSMNSTAAAPRKSMNSTAAAPPSFFDSFFESMNSTATAPRKTLNSTAAAPRKSMNSTAAAPRKSMNSTAAAPRKSMNSTAAAPPSFSESFFESLNSTAGAPRKSMNSTTAAPPSFSESFFESLNSTAGAPRKSMNSTAAAPSSFFESCFDDCW